MCLYEEWDIKQTKKPPQNAVLHCKTDQIHRFLSLQHSYMTRSSKWLSPAAGDYPLRSTFFQISSCCAHLNVLEHSVVKLDWFQCPLLSSLMQGWKSDAIQVVSSKSSNRKWKLPHYVIPCTTSAQISFSSTI